MEDIFNEDSKWESSFGFDAVIFDLDGVITQTARVHSAAWKATFDEYLQERERNTGEPFKEFTIEHDYLQYVDGKPRYDGVRSFLESRGISLPEGNKRDLPADETICGIGNRKNDKFIEVIEKNGVDVYEHVVEFIKDLKARRIHVGVASSSKNCQKILQIAGLEDLFETRIDGINALELGLRGKPAPDIFVKAADNMGVPADRAIVVEDAVSGVQAGVKGGFQLVIGVARENNEAELKANGADIIVTDFEGVSTETVVKWIMEKNKSDDEGMLRFGRAEDN